MRASALSNVSKASCVVSPFSCALDHNRRAEAGDHGNTASDNQCRNGVGSLS